MAREIAFPADPFKAPWGPAPPPRAPASLRLVEEGPADEDAAALHLQEAAALELGQGAGDRLARGAHHGRELGLAGALADHHALVGLLALAAGELADEVRHPAVHVEQGQ